MGGENYKINATTVCNRRSRAATTIKVATFDRVPLSRDGSQSRCLNEKCLLWCARRQSASLCLAKKLFHRIKHQGDSRIKSTSLKLPFLYNSNIWLFDEETEIVRQPRLLRHDFLIYLYLILIIMFWLILFNLWCDSVYRDYFICVIIGDLNYVELSWNCLPIKLITPVS